MGLLAGAIVMIAVILVGAALLSWLDERSTSAAGSSGAPGIGGIAGTTSPAATPRATPRPTPRVTPTPTPSPTPTPTPVLSPVIAGAIDQMRSAIDAAGGKGGLTKQESDLLSAQLGAVSSAAASGDRAGAITASGQLTSDVVDLVLSKRVRATAGDRLFASAIALGAAVATA